MRVAVIADGPPHLQGTNSGVAKGLLRGLAVNPAVSGTSTIDGRLGGFQLASAATKALFRRPNGLKAELRFGQTGIVARSSKRDAALERRAVDVVIHVRNVYLPTSTPYVAFIDSTTLQAESAWSPWVEAIGDTSARKIAEKDYYCNALAVCTASNAARDSVVDGYGVDPDRVHVVGGGVRFDPLPNGITSSRDLSEPLKVLFVGLDFERKGGYELLRAVDSMRSNGQQVVLDIVGIAPEAEIQRSHRDNQFHGVVRDGQTLSALYSEADVFCLPAHHEPFGLVVPEAMAHGLPCVGSRVGAMEEIISDGSSGIIVNPGSVTEIVDALQALSESEDLRRRMGIAGRRLVEERFNWPQVATNVMSAITEHQR